MDEKKVEEKKLEDVNGGGGSYNAFLMSIVMLNCAYCAKRYNGCPYGQTQNERFRNYPGRFSATEPCPEKE